MSPENSFFAEPVDVSLEYKKTAKSVPGCFVAFAICWAFGNFFLGILDPWALVAGYLLLFYVVIVNAVKFSRDRAALKRALALGPIVRVVEMTEDHIEVVDRSTADPWIVVAHTELSLVGLSEVTVSKDWIGLSGEGDSTLLSFSNDQFRDEASRRGFLVRILGHLEDSGTTGEHGPGEEFWIGKP